MNDGPNDPHRAVAVAEGRLRMALSDQREAAAQHADAVATAQRALADARRALGE